MTKELKTVNGYVKSVNLHCSVSEYLIIQTALKTFLTHKRENFEDRELAKKVLNVEPTIKESCDKEDLEWYQNQITD